MNTYLSGRSPQENKKALRKCKKKLKLAQLRVKKIDKCLNDPTLVLSDSPSDSSSEDSSDSDSDSSNRRTKKKKNKKNGSEMAQVLQRLEQIEGGRSAAGNIHMPGPSGYYGQQGGQQGGTTQPHSIISGVPALPQHQLGVPNVEPDANALQCLQNVRRYFHSHNVMLYSN